jgi:hypothetical protein
VFRDPAEAIERCVRLDSPIEPDPRTHDAYGHAHAAYRALAASASVRHSRQVPPANGAT